MGFGGAEDLGNFRQGCGVNFQKPMCVFVVFGRGFVHIDHARSEPKRTLIHERLDFDRSIQATQSIVRLARRCPPHRRRLRCHLGQLVVLFQRVTNAIKFQSLGLSRMIQPTPVRSHRRFAFGKTWRGLRCLSPVNRPRACA
jgi:hypothetical protein